MSLTIPLRDVAEGDRLRVGDKCFNLSRLLGEGFTLPPTLCVTTEAYDRHVDATGLRERIQLELHRKDLDEMRWEELWDAALRVRNMFLRTTIPPAVSAEILEALGETVGSGSVVVRSSAPGEDTAHSSFAGLHESFVNVRGKGEILDHLLMVWASLWSDAALLYRRELGLDLEKSTMAVAVQAFVEGKSSGVAFTVSPANRTAIAVEAVRGLNEGLVDGTVEPDRWTVDRESRRIVEYHRAAAGRYLSAARQGTVLVESHEETRASPPLSDGEVASLADLALRVERLFGTPQDVEWTISAGIITLLQSRPITSLSPPDEDDARGWYLSLRRSLGNLKLLQEEIENYLVPQMQREASELAGGDTRKLTDPELAGEIRRRAAILKRWKDLYREKFIPFAHGMRLFGMVYNRVLRPRDPYEFVDLLRGETLESIDRNAALQDLAEALRSDRSLAGAVERGEEGATGKDYLEKREDFIRRFGDLSCHASGATACGEERRVLDLLLLEMARHPPRKEKAGRESGRIEAGLIGSYPGGNEKEAKELLSVARASYRLRDNDNIYLGRIEAGVVTAAAEGVRRLGWKEVDPASEMDCEAVAAALEGAAVRPGAVHPPAARPGAREGRRRERPRQLVGQPAGPGLGTGKARVIRRHADLAAFRYGEVLVCDAVDPNMTFVAPLASAVVERRGGMLIHGAIIAREYGLPCVTGIAAATEVIRTGDGLSVDGYLGIVTLETSG